MSNPCIRPTSATTRFIYLRMSINHVATSYHPRDPHPNHHVTRPLQVEISHMWLLNRKTKHEREFTTDDELAIDMKGFYPNVEWDVMGAGQCSTSVVSIAPQWSV